MIENSRRYPIEPFSEQKIKNFLESRSVVSHELLSKGKNNTSYKINLSDGKSYILKIYKRGSAGSDRYVMDLVRDLVPVPTMLFAEDDWAILSFIEGTNMGKKPNECIEAAKIVGKLRTLRFEKPGQLGDDGSIKPWHFDGFAGFLDMMSENKTVQAWLSVDIQSELLKIAEREKSIIEEIDNESFLVHGDFNPGNILFENGQVSGVLDWEYAHAGTQWMDVGNLLRHLGDDCARFIEEGLKQVGVTVPADWKKRARLVDVTSQLEFLSSSLSDQFKKSCVQRVMQFIAHYE